MQHNRILFANKLASVSQFPQSKKQAIAAVIDMAWVVISIWVAFFLSGDVHQIVSSQIIAYAFLSSLIAIPVFMLTGLYRIIIRYLSANVFWAVLKSVSLFCVAWAVLGFLFLPLLNQSGVFFSIVVINWMLLILFVGGSRVIGSWLANTYLDVTYQDDFGEGVKNVLIYGAGEAGLQLVSGLAAYRNTKVIGFVDDNDLLCGQSILGIKVYKAGDLRSIVAKKNITEILLAVPSASRSRRAEILVELESLAVQVRTLPDIAAIVAGRIKVQDVREIDISDLLGRQSVPPDIQLMRQTIENQVVMVTGSGGSIGSELCRQICLLNPKKIIMYERNEFNLYTMNKEFTRRGVDFVSVLGSVNDQKYLASQCQHYGVDTIFHAAAYKHVPLLESNVLAAVENNILGTYCAAMAAIDAEVKCFVLISSDKAVRPTNVMGATKRFSEQILQALNAENSHTRTKFVIVRFGNVIDSSGSVIPLFREQIDAGGPVTVTDPQTTRYFMTIPEASQLVIQASAMGKGGEVYVLDMGEAVRIYDLAAKMVRLSGLTLKEPESVNDGIQIQYSGLRPGEKLHEELLIGDDVSITQHEKIMMVNENFLSWERMSSILDELKSCIASHDSVGVRKILTKVVEGYTPEP